MVDPWDKEFTCLAIEPASQICSIAACCGVRTSIRSEAEPRDQSRHIFESVREVLDDLDLSLAALDCIAFGCGPGGFTGLRVGAAAVQALSFGASIPVCRISSLASMALGAMQQHGARVVATCLDARMDEAYLAVYRAENQSLMSVQLEDCLVDPMKFTLDPTAEIFAAGPGWSACGDMFDRHTELISGNDFELLPSAEKLLALAEERFQTGQTISAGEALPNYIRDKVTR
jgi:tRNA threonylcarbamoyladenosine biosynthesis protein TsaB